MNERVDLRAFRPALLPQFFEYGGCVFARGVASTSLYRAYRRGEQLAGQWSPDRTGAEALENHLHPLDVIARGRCVRKTSSAFRAAELIAQVIAHVWLSQLTRAFPGQRFRIYCARNDEPTVRFHRCYRGEHPWLNETTFKKEVSRGYLLVLETTGRAA